MSTEQESKNSAAIDAVFRACLNKPTKQQCASNDGGWYCFERQAAFPVIYKGSQIGEHRVDLIVEKAVVVELKSVERYDPEFMAQVLTYLRCTGLRVACHHQL